MRDGRLYVLGRMRAAAVLTDREFRKRYPARAKAFGSFNLSLGGRWPQRGVRAQILFLAHSCVTDVVVGAEGTGLVFDRAVPVAEVPTIRYVSKRGERPIKYADDGEFRAGSMASIQGNYRLSGASAELLGRVLAGAATPMSK